MYASSLVSFSLVEMLTWYMILSMLNLFPSGHSFCILQLHECFKLSLLFQSSYSCTNNISKIIDDHNKKLLNKLIFILFLIIFLRELSSLKCLFIKPRKYFPILMLQSLQKGGLN